MKYYLYLFVLLSSSVFANGLSNPDVTQNNLKDTVCKSNWTRSIRPSTYKTGKIKKQMMSSAGISLTEISKYDLDHIIPLSSGGHPIDKQNLMLQLWAGADGAKAKDVIEISVK